MTMTTEQQINDYLLKLKNLNEEKDEAGISDMVLELQDFLIEAAVITKELKPGEKSQESAIAKEIADIFLDVRREYQRDEEPVSDFGYLLVSDDWLYAHGIKSYAS